MRTINSGGKDVAAVRLPSRPLCSRGFILFAYCSRQRVGCAPTLYYALVPFYGLKGLAAR